MTRVARVPLFACCALLSIALVACAGELSEPDDGESCGTKCEDPGSTADHECRQMCPDDPACEQECRDERAIEHCEARRSDALDSAQQAFTENAVRWACADVEGVNTNGRDDRGQEYCEYYAIVQPPPANDGDAAPEPVTLGRNRSFGSPTDLSLDLTEDQTFALEDHPDAVVGQCIFTSWHQDIDVRLPVCGDSNATCPLLTLPKDADLPPWQNNWEYQIPLTDEYFRMKISINSNNAAADLFEKCLVEPPAGDPANQEDVLHSGYMRGCWKSYELFRTEWRRSDPTVCAAGVRVSECGCGVDTDGDGKADITDPREVSRALVPFQPDDDGTLRLRGFHLGTWSGMNELPTGCRYIETGDQDSTRTIVACHLTGSDVLTSLSDPKGRCREKYGDNVVVHVPIPAAAIVCEPPTGGQYADSCGDMPWIVSQ